VTIDGVLDWVLDLLTTYAHDLELQSVTTPPLISIIHKSPQHPLSLFHPVVCVFTSRSLVTASNRGYSWASAHKSSLNGGSLPAFFQLPHFFTAPRTKLMWLESESELLYDWRFTANQFVLAPSPLRLTARIIFLNWAPMVIVLI
jgi:hypothetical protein